MSSTFNTPNRAKLNAQAMIDKASMCELFTNPSVSVRENRYPDAQDEALLDGDCTSDCTSKGFVVKTFYE